NFHGHKVYKNIPVKAAVIAWGKVVCGGGETDLATGADWKCMRHTAYTRYTPKLTFALFAQTYYDQKMFDEKWIETDFCDCHWPAAVELADQNCFGELEPRGIPFMEMTDVPLNTKTKIFPHTADEDWHSFMMEIPIETGLADKRDVYCQMINWFTYVYSPCAQQVTAGVLYEQLWINGERAVMLADDGRSLRYNCAMRLNEGWNYIFGTVTLYQDVYNCYLALPKGRGLVVSATKELNGKYIFGHTPLLPMERDIEIRALPLPWDSGVSIDSLGGWVLTSEADRASCPCREGSWDSYGAAFEVIEKDAVNGFTVKKHAYPNGFTMVFDMEYMRLVFPVLKLRGVKGATVDLLYSDRYEADGRHVWERSWVPLGDRVVCGNDTLDWTLIQPRGFQYMAVCVRGAGSDVVFENMRFVSAHYPVKKIGSFECSDKLLNKIWEACALTQSVNMEDAYDDCVDRERGSYALDVHNQYQNNLVVFGDHMLAKRSLEIYGQSGHSSGFFRGLYPNTGDYLLKPFSFYILDMFHSYYNYSGDAEVHRRWWEPIMNCVNALHAIADEHPKKLLCFVKQSKDAEGGQSGSDVHMGVSCTLSCLYLMTLRTTAKLAEAIEKKDDLHKMRGYISVLERSIPETFWVGEKSLFKNNGETESFTLHANMFAWIVGLVPENALDGFKTKINGLLNPVYNNGFDSAAGSTFHAAYGYYFFDHLYKNGMAPAAEECIKLGWGWFLAKGLKTTPEHFNVDESRCHAWTSTPMYALSRHALGVKCDLETGLGHVVIDVKPGTLEWAKGTFPHAKGTIEIEWHKENGKIIFDKAAVPNGVTYEIKGWEK
ncbi:MAG: hypothetical protein FWE82_09445, partial [Defluviitaleaceae bacterium]|nr:hypothetical protein [Defluviitaleaceae bacterium]